MAKQPIPTRLNLQDVRDLIAAKAALDAVIRALQTTNWAGATTSIAALAAVDGVIIRLYNRAEPHWLKYLGLEPPETPAGAPGENEPAPLDTPALKAALGG